MKFGKSYSFFRDGKNGIKTMLNCVEEPAYSENPLGFFIRLARYKFPSRFIKSTDHVIDIGCGAGIGTTFLSNFSEHVTGADIDNDLISHNIKTNKNKKIDFIPFDLLKPHKKKYDVVVSMDVIEHFNRNKSEIVAENYAKLTKPNGFAVIGTPNKFSNIYASQGRIGTHLHEFEPQELEELLLGHFKRVFLFSMTDETISTAFIKMAWYLVALCTK